ncbi:MAG TPA: PrsW family intramembrane metalloprotease [Candidatus Thermoplasmatota archaeon]|nr:PrsW family intramembrane metalloprotease [Candidatus Thermoplasmatota archaeon]
MSARVAAVRESLRRMGVLAWSETRRTSGAFDWRTRAVLLALAVGMGLLAPTVLDDGLAFDRGIYRAAVAPASPLLAAVEAAPAFQVIVTGDPVGELSAGRADVSVGATRVSAPPTDKGRAALAALKQAAADYTFRELRFEADQAAAFPIRIELEYVPTAGGRSTVLPGLPSQPPRTPPSGGEDGAGEGDGGTGGSDDGGASAPPPPPPPPPSGAPGGFQLLPPEIGEATPQTLAPPFPFRSLVLAYLFLIPMNFVVQVYAGSAIAERLQRKGEPLLASPARPWEIVVGKALPYFAAMMGVCAIIALAIGGGVVSVLAVAPLALVFLAAEFVAAMFARSFRELTFLTVFASVMITIYAFLPAVFTGVSAVALVSPITLVVMDLRGAPIELAQALYATVPLTFVSFVLFLLGTALYREEDLFHQKRVAAKALDALARQVRGVGSGFKIAILLIPLVLVAELLLVTFLFAWPIPLGVAGVLLAVALVEEVAKGLPSLAAVDRRAILPQHALAFGALTGVGFFVAEKGFLLASLVGLFGIPEGAAVFGMMTPGGALPLAGLLLLAPLALHVATATLSAWGASKGRRPFAIALLLAILAHAAYNATVLGLGGASP